MISAYLILVPWVSGAVFRLSEPANRLALVAAPGDEVHHPSHPTRSFGAPERPDAGGPSSPLSDRAARVASRGWEWKALETPGWKILMAEHFVVRGDVPVGDLRAAGAYLEEFLRMLRSAIGGDTSGIMFSIRIFSNPRDFRIYAGLAGAPNAESFYDPRTAEVVVCPDRAKGRPYFQWTLAHEFTHEYMDRVWRRTEPLWFAEGMAEYFSNFHIQEGQVRAGSVDRAAVRRLREGAPVPLSRFVALGRDAFYGEGFPFLYAQAWALVHYLFAKRPDLVDLLLRGQRLQDVEKLEDDWRRYLERLE